MMSAARTLRRSIALGVVLAALVVTQVPDPAHATSGKRIVHTEAGAVRGSSSAGTERYLGIPYAAAPAGPERWKAPAAVKPWSGVRDATGKGPACMQDRAALRADITMSEDCLNLSITRPAGNRELPVIVWVHGGGFTSGTSAEYDPERLAREGNVVVTVNYRLGIFGGFTHESLGKEGAFGLLDQQAALRWVQRNIEAFNGDRGNVTLAGQSAGAMSVCSQLASPSAAGLFHKAVIASGSCLTRHPAGAISPDLPALTNWYPVSEVAAMNQELAGAVGCKGKNVLPCLRTRPASELMSISPLFTYVPYGTKVLPDNPAVILRARWAQHVPVLSGTTRDEHLLTVVDAYPSGKRDDYTKALNLSFGKKAKAVAEQYPVRASEGVQKTLNRVYTDADWTCPTIEANQRYAAGSRTWTYEFADPNAPALEGPVARGLRPASTHGSDLNHLFWTRTDTGDLTPSQRRLGDTIVKYWSNFAHHGDPNGRGLPRWPSTDKYGRAIVLSPDQISITRLAEDRNCSFWSKLG